MILFLQRNKGMKEESLIKWQVEVSLFMCIIFILEMDTTLISEIEYVNMLPDMDMDDISFLKGSFVNGTAQRHDRSEDINKSQLTEEQVKRISELEKLVET